MANEEFTITGIAPSYAFMLMVVNADPGIQPSDIARHMQLSPSTVTRLIEKMEYKQLLTRKQEGKNTLVYPTQKSKDLDVLIHNAWNNLYKRYTNILGEKTAAELTNNIYVAFSQMEK